MNLILLSRSLLDESGVVFLAVEDPIFIHIFEVLNLGSGDRVKVGILNGPVGEATVEWTNVTSEATVDVCSISATNVTSEGSEARQKDVGTAAKCRHCKVQKRNAAGENAADQKFLPCISLVFDNAMYLAETAIIVISSRDITRLLLR